MSYLTQLQTNNTNLQACIDKANALPEAGSGGGSVETCTVEIEIALDKKTYATIINESGEVTTVEVICTESLGGGHIGVIILENVLCNSIIYCQVVSWNLTITGTAKLLVKGDKEQWSIFNAPSVANEHCIIQCL